jgi:hypothetical protein
MTYRQTERSLHEDDLERLGADVAELEEAPSTLQRKTLYEGLRKRDALLRRPWGARGHVAAELQ